MKYSICFFCSFLIVLTMNGQVTDNTKITMSDGTKKSINPEAGPYLTKSSNSSNYSETTSSSSKQSSSSTNYNYVDPYQGVNDQIQNISETLNSFNQSNATSIYKGINSISFDNSSINDNQEKTSNNWEENRSKFIDKSDDEDYTELLAKSELMANHEKFSFDKDWGYVLVSSPDFKTSPELSNNYDPQSLNEIASDQTTNQNNNNSTREDESLKRESGFKSEPSDNIVDKAIDKVIDNQEIGMGTRLKSIKEIGNLSTNLVKDEINNYFDESNPEKSEQLFSNYKSEVSKAFVNAVPEVRKLSETYESFKSKLSSASEYLKKLFNDKDN